LEFYLVLLLVKKNRVKKESLTSELSHIEKIRNISDSLSIQGITVKNLFKNQILAHQENYDNIIIIEKVYRPH